jgi:RNA polymerase sigma-70 factor, ECF subfamily
MTVNFVNSSSADDELLQAIKLKNTAAMQVLYKRHSSAVFAFAFRRLGDESFADEVVNDTLLQVWNSASTFTNQSAVKTWILGIAKNKILDVLRKQGKSSAREVEISDEELNQIENDEPGAYAQLLDKQKSHHLVTCFTQLSAEQQSCLHLFIVEGLSLEEIGQTLNVPSNTVATRIHHAKRKLREKLESIFGKGDV